jgi:hypothetical protein
MLINQITVYACKSKRNNSKCDIKTIKAYRENDNSKILTGLKYDFTKDNMVDLKDFLTKSKYKNCYRLVVFNGNTNLRNWQTGYFVDEYSLMNVVNTFVALLNK